jgi:phage repressor protein C with HTH and peptisase S24 domain
MDQDFINRIHRLIDDAGGQSALARKSGLSLGAIQRYMKGGEPTRGALIRLAESCGVTMAWLISGDSPDAQTHTARQHGPDVPVYGFAECGLQGWYNESRLRISTSLDWPDPDIYAVIAAGHSMAPEGIHPGYICIVSPNTRPQRGDAVLIRRNDNTATIKLYQREDQDWLHVTGWLDPERPGDVQQPFTDTIKRTSIARLATVIMVKRRA